MMNEAQRAWRNQEFSALIDFARQSRCEHGFSTMDATGNADQSAALQLWINCRMTHVFA